MALRFEKVELRMGRVGMIGSGVDAKEDTITPTSALPKFEERLWLALYSAKCFISWLLS